MELITNSRLKTFNACRRLHQYEYEMGVRPVETEATAADFGTLFHAGLEGWWTAWMRGRGSEALAIAREYMAQSREKSDVLDEIGAAKADLLMVAYDVRWAADMEDLEVLAVEAQFNVPIIAPSGRPCRAVRAAGKMDAITRRLSTRKKLLVEHKTTGSDLSQGSTYWRRLRMDPQISIYFDGARSLGHEIDECLYDVVVRPEHRPYTATPLEKRKFTKEGRLYANQRERDESMDEFQARMAKEIADDPNAWFARAQIVRLPEELEQSRRDMYETTLAIRAARKTGAPRNPDACLRFNRECGFYDVCSGAASLDDPGRFRRLDSVHPELVHDEAA